MTRLHLTFALAAAAAIVPATVFAAPPRAASPVAAGSPLIDYDGYAALTRDVRPLRAKRLLGLDEFKRRAADSRTLVLDARSATAFAQGHIAGAVNLPFTDFTAETLAAAIGPDRNRPILIYCNNNFTDDRLPVRMKMTPRATALGRGSPVALNIQTFVNLVGYGYRNVWELGEAVTMADPRVGWVAAAG